MNKDYTIVIHTDTPVNLDILERHLLGDWDATMTNHTTGDRWRKEAAPQPETSLTASAAFTVVPEDDTYEPENGWNDPTSPRV